MTNIRHLRLVGPPLGGHLRPGCHLRLDNWGVTLSMMLENTEVKTSSGALTPTGRRSRGATRQAP
jgi:hypothetical protein